MPESPLPLSKSYEFIREKLNCAWRDFVRRAKWRDSFATALMLVGIALLVYVGVQYGIMLATQHRLAHQWEGQQKIRTASTVESDGLVRLTIPKIDLNAVVVEGTTHQALLIGPGHMEDTPEPGNLGNSVISGHRDTFFRRIHELERGDIVLVQHDGKTFSYQVTGKKVVSPDDTAVIQPSDGSHLTLITCYPTHYIGPAPQRLVVFTKQVNSPPPPTETASGPEIRQPLPVALEPPRANTARAAR